MPSDYCVYSDELCGAGDSIGHCLPRPPCGQPDPVCGCDGKVYDDACKAAIAGVDVTVESKCTAAGGSSGSGGGSAGSSGGGGATGAGGS